MFYHIWQPIKNEVIDQQQGIDLVLQRTTSISQKKARVVTFTKVRLGKAYNR